MYSNWPFFREMIDLIAMTLSKTDYSVSANYELQLVNKDGESTKDLNELGNQIRANLVKTRKNVLSVTDCDDLSSNFGLLQQSMKVRNPYVDPLNVLQAETMKRLRSVRDGTIVATPEDIQLLEDTIVISINGIASGMKNSG